MTKKHAKLSASGSERWLNCPGSVKACEGYPNKSSTFAQEGTLAHELADRCLKQNKDADQYIGKPILYSKIESDMARYVQEYLDYVRSFETKNTQLLTEERVDFSNIVPKGFGTMDAAVINYQTSTCHIFDLKYGQGIKVDAENNTQAQLYALGLLNELDFIGDIDKFVLHIVQPRVNHFDDWEVSTIDLKLFGEYAKQRAELALSKDAPIIPGDKQCQWCLAKADCEALAKHTEQIIASEFENLDQQDQLETIFLTDERKKLILDNKSLIESFLKAVEKDVFDRLIEGEQFAGYKLVEGRSVRQWKDGAELLLVNKLGDDAYDKKLIGITAAQKLIGKDEVDQLTIKPQGKTTLVPESDKRKAIELEKIEDYFENNL